MSKTYKYILDFSGNNRSLVGAIDQNKAKLTELDRKAADSKRALGETFGGVEKIKSGLLSFAGAAGLAFGTAELVSFTKDLVKLGGEAEGVQAAFDKIADANYLSKLRDSVHGTVSDLNLMKRAVQASNFDIPLSQLGSLFAFATKRAQDTGQSVDYLVDSIVLGIGRKSPLILDNLGISAVQLREKFHGLAVEERTVADIAQAVGEIAQAAMEKSGDILDTNAIKLQSLSAQWENFKMQLATNEGFKNAASSEINELSDNLEVFFSTSLSGWDKFKAAADFTGMGGQIEYLAKKSRQFKLTQEENTEAVKKFQQTYNSFLPSVKPFRFYDKTDDIKNFNEFWSTVTNTALPTIFKVIPDNAAGTTKTYSDTFEGLNERLKDYNSELIKIAPNDQAAITAKLQQIIAIEKQIKAVDELKKKIEDSQRTITDPMYGQKMVQIMPTWVNNGGFNLDAPLNLDGEPTGLATSKDWLTPFKKQQEEARAELELTQQKQEAVRDAFQSGFEAIGQSVIDGLGLASDGLEGFVGGLLETAVKIISTMMAQSLATAIFNSQQSATATGPAAVFTAPSFTAMSIAGVMSAFSQIPAFADGGIVYGPTMGLMGEYPGARSNPEVIAPLSKLQAMISRSGNDRPIILQPSVDFTGDKMRVMLNSVENKRLKRVGR